MNKKWIRYLVGLAITLLTLWLSFRNLDWTTLKDSLANIKFIWVLPAALNTLFSVYLLSWRWQLILRAKENIPLTDLFKVNIISQYLNILLPGRFGELLKVWLVSRRHNHSGFYVLGTVVVDKMFDFFSIVTLGAFVPLFFAFKEELKGYTVAIIVCAALIPILAIMVWKKDMVRRWLIFFTRFLPRKFGIREKALQFFEKGIEAFSLLKNVKMMLKLTAITLVLIMSQALTNFILFQAYGIKLSIWAALVLQLILLIGMAPPSVPGKVGIFEYAVIFGLSTTFGLDKSLAFSYALMLHLVAYLPKIILGFVFMGSYNISLKKAESEMKQFNEKTEETRETKND
ncbi:MAG: flippase-like domain-containing protein [bacterium]|nr:flippase-like domain-containing protein [bacterium]